MRVHLAGHGGDEVFHETATYLHDLLRTRPLTALTHLRGFRALCRWPWPGVIRALADRRGLDAWWREQADRLTGPRPSRYAHGLPPERARADVAAITDRLRAANLVTGS